MSSFNSLLGYSVAVGDFNEDGEDGKTFQYFFFFNGITILLYFADFFLSLFFYLSLSEQIFEKHYKIIIDDKCLSL